VHAFNLGKVENIPLGSISRVDTLISEPIGVFLVHERMIESYLYARDHFLKPISQGGKMYPSHGSIFVAPFTDANIWTQTMAKARFWEQTLFYGVDLSPLFQDAMDEAFGQPVVGGFDYRLLMAEGIPFTFDFQTMSIDELKEFVIPFSWTMTYTGIIHGLASWFDITLGDRVLSTSPHLERTHWHQIRLIIKEPVAVNIGDVVHGNIHFKVNNMRSYDINLKIQMGNIVRTGKYLLHEQSYYFDAPNYQGDVTPEQMGLYENLSR
jgi:histone-arginine methyltransferase CARM1